MRALLFLAICATAFGSPRVYFSPKGGCTEAAVKEIAKARKSILVQAYSFTSSPIAAALEQAKKRGVDVKAIFDRSQKTAKGELADEMAKAHVPCWDDDRHAIAHNKVMVIDGHVLLTGSFNWTKSAEEHNAENLLILDDADLAKAYAENWERHRAHSKAW